MYPQILRKSLILVAAVVAVPALAEDWPGYEGGNLHHNASSVDIDPAGLEVLWQKRFDKPVDCRTTNPGFYGSRNLALVDGKLAVVACIEPVDVAKVATDCSYAYVTVLDARTGKVLNCIATTQATGPRRHQMQYPLSNHMEAYDTGIGITVMHWDPTSGILFLRNGGDNPSNTAYLPLANAASFAGRPQKGVGAYEDFIRRRPDWTDADGHTRQQKEIICSKVAWGRKRNAPPASLPDGGEAAFAALADTAEVTPEWEYAFHSPHQPETPEDAESYLELDAFHRNKAWLLDGGTVWAAWKPTRAGCVQLIRCDAAGSRTFELPVGKGQRGQDLWPHISLATVGETRNVPPGTYIAYYAGNALYRKFVGSQWSPAEEPPLGPAALAVFDVSAGVVGRPECTRRLRAARDPATQRGRGVLRPIAHGRGRAAGVYRLDGRNRPRAWQRHPPPAGLRPGGRARTEADREDHRPGDPQGRQRQDLRLRPDCGRRRAVRPHHRERHPHQRQPHLDCPAGRRHRNGQG